MTTTDQPARRKAGHPFTIHGRKVTVVLDDATLDSLIGIQAGYGINRSQAIRLAVRVLAGFGKPEKEDDAW